MKALEPLDGDDRRLGRTQRHLRQRLEDQQGARRQAILPAAAIRGDLPLLPSGSLPAGGPSAAQDLRRVPRRGEGAHEGRTCPASACAAAPAGSTTGGRSCSAAAQASRRAAWSPTRRSPPTAGTSALARDAKVTPASARDRQLPPDRRRLQGRPHRDDHPPCRLGERDRRRARRQGVGGAGAACGRTASGWTYFGDESNAVFSASKAKEAAFKWIAFLSTAENNVELNKLTGQLPITTSGGAELDRASEALRRGERRLAADRRLAARQPEDAGLHRAHLADQHAARADRRDLAGRHDEGDRAALPRLSDPASDIAAAGPPPPIPDGSRGCRTNRSPPRSRLDAGLVPGAGARSSRQRSCSCRSRRRSG